MASGAAPVSRGTAVSRGISVILLGGAASKLVLLASELVLARSLGTADFGAYAIGVAAVTLLASVSLLGVDYGVIQQLARFAGESEANERASILRVGFFAVAVVGGIVAMGLFLVADAVGRTLSGPGVGDILKVAVVALFFEALNNYFSAVFRGLRRFADHGLSFDGVRNGVVAAGIPIVVLFELGAVGAMTAFAAGSVAGTIFAIIRLWRVAWPVSEFSFDRPAARDMIRFSRGLAVWGILQTSSTQLYVLIAGAFLNGAEVGALAAGLRVVIILNFFRTSLTAGLQREFAELHLLSDSRRLGELLQRSSQSLFVVGGLVALPFLIAPTIAMGLVGDEWRSYAWILWPLLLPKLLNVAGGPVGQLLIACGRARAVVAIGVGELLVQLCFLLPFMAVWGLAGAVAGEAIRVVLVVGVRHVVVRRSVGLLSITATHVGVLASLSVAIVFGYAVVRAIGGLPGYLAALVLAVVLYEGLLRAFTSHTMTVIGLLRRVLRTMRPGSPAPLSL